MEQPVNNSKPGATKGARTEAQELLRQYRISPAAIAAAIGLEYGLVRRALIAHEVGRVGHGTIVMVRWQAERMLRACGWDGESASLWAEYDEPFKAAA